MQVRVFFVTILLIAVVMAGAGSAMPPHPRIANDIRSGVIAKPLMLDNPLLAPTPAVTPMLGAKAAAPIVGEFRALCILVDFSDNHAVTPGVEYDSLLFAATNSVRHFYSEASYGQLDIVAVDWPSSIGWQRAPNDYAYYVDNAFGTDSPYPHNSQRLCEDLVDLVDPVVDFSRYDNDGNGSVDVVMIVHAGAGAEFTGNSSDMWSHKWAISPRSKDGVTVSDFAVMPEYWRSSGDMTIGVFCHELGHGFGLPDLYDTDNSSYGVGCYSVMSYGSWNGFLGDCPALPDAWSKYRLGWVTPQTISENQSDVAIPRVEDSPVIYRFWAGTGGGNEYYLLENRRRVGYDASLPAEGLFIWHIDDGARHNKYEWYPGFTDFGHYLVALEQADNQYQLEKRLSDGDAGDAFPGSSGNRSFTPLSMPSSQSYTTTAGMVAVTNISAPGDVMTADFAVSLDAGDGDTDEAPDALPVFSVRQNYPNPFNPTTSIHYTIPVETRVRCTIYNVLGECVVVLADDLRPAGTHTLTWDGTDSHGHTVAGGIYLYEIATNSNRAVRKMLMLK